MKSSCEQFLQPYSSLSLSLSLSRSPSLSLSRPLSPPLSLSLSLSLFPALALEASFKPKRSKIPRCFWKDGDGALLEAAASKATASVQL